MTKHSHSRWWLALVIVTGLNAWIVSAALYAIIEADMWSSVFLASVTLMLLFAAGLSVLMVRLWRRARGSC